MAAPAVLQALGADSGAAVRATAFAHVTHGPGLLRAGARFQGGPRRALQCDRAAAFAIPRETFQQPAHRGAAHLLRRRAAPAFLGRNRSAPSAAAPAVADRNPAQRRGPRRAAGAHRGVLGPRTAEGRLVAATAVHRELGAHLTDAQVRVGGGQRAQRHGGARRADQPAFHARCLAHAGAGTPHDTGAARRAPAPACHPHRARPVAPPDHRGARVAFARGACRGGGRGERQAHQLPARPVAGAQVRLRDRG